MNNKNFGIALIIIGVALAFVGLQFYGLCGVTDWWALSVDTPIEAWLGMVGGADLPSYWGFEVK